jgi:membrane glycosyltransferase
MGGGVLETFFLVQASEKESYIELPAKTGGQCKDFYRVRQRNLPVSKLMPT